MRKQIRTIHLIIGFSLLFFIPISKRIDYDLGELPIYLAIGYWGLVGLCGFVKITKELIAERGLKTFVFKSWLYLSVFSGVAGLYAIVMSGLDDALWAFWLVAYGAIVGYIFRKDLI